MRHSEVSIILTVQESSKGFPVAFIDIDRYLSEKFSSHEIIVCGYKSDIRLARLQRNMRSVIAGAKFIRSESRSLGAMLKEGVIASNGGHVLWVDTETVFDAAVANQALSALEAVGNAKADVVFALPAADSAAAKLSRRLSRAVAKLGSSKANLIAFSRDAAENMLNGLPFAGADFAFDIALAAKRAGRQIAELESSAQYIFPGANSNLVAECLSAIKVRAKFEAGLLRSVSVLQKA